MPIRRTHRSPEEALKEGSPKEAPSTEGPPPETGPAEEDRQTLSVVLMPNEPRRLAALSGQFDEHLRHIEKQLNIKIKNRGNHFELAGPEEDVERGRRVLEDLYALTETEDVDPERVHMALVEHTRRRRCRLERRPRDPHAPAHRARARPESNRVHARDARARSHDRHRARGHRQDLPSGGRAVEALSADAVRRIVLVRPAVEAGERLGFLPGDMSQKIDPYLRPMYDALYEMMGFDRVGRLIERHVIEIAPLAFMRGRTLNESFVILDEAQNTTPEQMKMFLTRIGFGSRAVVTGDITQTDLPRGKESGLRHAMRVLRNVKAIAFVHFTAEDVVRHPLVQSIVAAYAKDEESKEGKEAD